MKQKYYFVNIVVTTLFSVFLSNCSFGPAKIVYDTTHNLENYKVESSSSNISSKEYVSTFAIMPKIVSEIEYKPLIIPGYNEGYIGPIFGIDYDITYLGYDTEKLISDVLKNRRSLSDALEYPAFDSDDEHKLSLTVLHITYLFGTKFFNGGLNIGYGTPVYSAVTFGGIKYDINDYLMWKLQVTQKHISINWYSALSLVDFEAKSKNSPDTIDVNYIARSAGFRFGF